MDKKPMDVTSEVTQEPAGKKSILRWIITVIVVIAVILVCLYGVSRFTKFNILGIDKDGSGGKWQAVFLSNGQVYFGNLEKDTDKEVILTNIYYLQVTTALQPADSTQAQQGLSLVKLGNELHGPKDEMSINKAHVVFIEELKTDGKVVTAINQYIADQKK